MPFAVTNFAELAYMMEQVSDMGEGTIPNAPAPGSLPDLSAPNTPTKRMMRYTGHTISKKSNFANSTEIRSDRQIVDAMRLGSTLDGDINIEFSADTYDDMLVGLMSPLERDWIRSQDLNTHSSYWTYNSSTGLLSATAGTPVVSNPNKHLKLGDWVRMGYGTIGPDGIDPVGVGFGRVSSVDATTGSVTLSHVQGLPQSIQAVQLYVEGVTVVCFKTFSVCSYLENDGKAPKKYINWYFEDERTDLEGTVFKFKHLKVVGLNLQIQSQAIITGAFNMMGTGMEIADATSFGGYPTQLSGTSTPMTATENVGVLYESIDGEATAAKFKSVNLTITNNGRGQDVITREFARDIALGTFNLTISSQAYFMNKTLYAKFVNNIETSMAFTLTGNDNNGVKAVYIFDIPRLKITAATATPSGLDQDQMVDLTMQALKDLTLNYTFRISKFTY